MNGLTLTQDEATKLIRNGINFGVEESKRPEKESDTVTCYFLEDSEFQRAKSFARII